ncbi:10452_t:CDS:1, partial [Acaulospora colombiana]
VNQQNSGLQSMDTEQILDLFNVTSDKSGQKSANNSSVNNGGLGSKGKKISTKNVLDGLENLWDDSQYEDLNLDNFIESLNSDL